ncbi:MAG: transaldolase, partial [Acetobacteraceae bacterium]|nr:transaldolase [Acetobacteraceae bacterium]
DAEPLGSPQDYGKDRFFAYLALRGETDDAQARAADALEHAGHPVVRLSLTDRVQIGQQFFLWEIATAAAGAVIGINPFDQPDVEASKQKTRALTSEYEQTGKLPAEEPIFRANGVALYADPNNARALGQHNALGGYIRSHLDRVKPGDYVALLAYINRTQAHTGQLQTVRGRIRDKSRAATCLGFGPRFLHSTGQAYKGGPNSGVFLQITCDDPAEVNVPGQKYTFGVVKAAQARGDFDVLSERGRRALRLHLSDADGGLQEFARAVEQALA